MKETEKSWLAGFIEGEGCLTILKNTDRRRKRTYVQYRPIIVISNTSLKLLEHIQNLIGVGRIYDRVHIFPNAKLQHALHIYMKNDILQLCKDIEPYLFSKKEQLKLLVQACQDSEDIEHLYEKIHRLNHKGEN